MCSLRDGWMVSIVYYFGNTFNPIENIYSYCIRVCFSTQTFSALICLGLDLQIRLCEV